VNVDIEIDAADASLRGAVRTSFVPSPATRLRIPDIGKPQAPPLRQLTATSAGKLPRKYDFLATLVCTEDMRT